MIKNLIVILGGTASLFAVAIIGVAICKMAGISHWWSMLFEAWWLARVAAKGM